MSASIKSAVDVNRLVRLGLGRAVWLCVLCVVVLSSCLLAPQGVAAEPAEKRERISIGSKNFGESYLLAEIAAQLLEARGFEVQRRFGLGGTLICYGALVEGEIDLYVEYTGTLAQAVLKSASVLSLTELNNRMPDLEMLAPLGFNNTYAMSMRAAQADQLGIATISDLIDHPQLRIVVSHEFLEREDGWPGLSAHYGLVTTPSGIEHGLAYQALADGAIDVTDAYSTDGELSRYALRNLRDDQGFFPEYLAAPLVRRDLPVTAKSALAELANQLTAIRMQELNAAVLVGAADGKADFASIARGYLAQTGLVVGASEIVGLDSAARRDSRLWRELRQNTWRHLQLTFIALLGAVLVGVGVGALVFRSPLASKVVISVCGLLQTVPSIALLALMIPVFGIGFIPAIVALFLYALLPILRNTVVALSTIDPELIRTATAIGLGPRERLRHLLLPMALPNIFAGIRTAAVICVGTATLAAFIGAGGLGDPIVTGLSLNDTNLILRGAIPAALLAMLFELGFEVLERWLVPAPLRAERRLG